MLAGLGLQSLMAGRGARHGAMAAAVVAVVALASVGIISTRTDWRAAIDLFASERAPTAPVIKTYVPQHPLAHYERQPQTSALRQGISVDLSWREFSLNEVMALAMALNGAPEIWLVGPADDSLAAAVREALRPAYDTVDVITAGEIRFWRLDANR